MLILPDLHRLLPSDILLLFLRVSSDLYVTRFGIDVIIHTIDPKAGSGCIRPHPRTGFRRVDDSRIIQVAVGVRKWLILMTTTTRGMYEEDEYDRRDGRIAEGEHGQRFVHGVRYS